MSYPRPPTGVPINEAILQVDQQITLCLQRIDASFAQAHETIQGSILPKVKQYGEQSLQIGEASKFWRMFFETAAQVRLTQADEDQLEEQEEEHGSYDDQQPFEDSEEYKNEHVVQENNQSFDDSLLVSPPGATTHRSPPRPSLGALKDEEARHAPHAALDQSNDSFMGDATPRAQRHHHPVPEEPTHESPFNRAKRDFAIRAARKSADVQPAPTAKDDENDSLDAPLIDSRLSTPRAPTGKARAPTEQEEGKEAEQEDRIATPPQVSRESLNPSGMNKRRTSLAAAATANMTRNRFGAKVLAQPLDGVSQTHDKPTNPFAQGSPTKRTPLAGVQPDSSRTDERNNWDGIADLRVTPIRAAGNTGTPIRAVQRSASPPRTLPFSVGRDKYLKTPAKEAARRVVDDLMRTAERHTLDPEELISRRHAEYALAKQSPSQPQRSAGALFQDEPAAAGGPGSVSGSGSGSGLGEAKGVVGTPLRREHARRSGLPTPPQATAYYGRSSREDPSQVLSQSGTAEEEVPSSAQRLMGTGEGLDLTLSHPGGAEPRGPLARFAAQQQEFAHPGAPASAHVQATSHQSHQDDSDSDSDDDSDDSDESEAGGGGDGGVPTGRPGTTGPILGFASRQNNSNPTPSSASLLSSRSGLSSDLSAAQALKDDTLFGSKLGANPFLFNQPHGSTSGSASGSQAGSVSRPGGGFAPRGDVGNLGTFNMGRPLVGEEDLSSPLKRWNGQSDDHHPLGQNERKS